MSHTAFNVIFILLFSQVGKDIEDFSNALNRLKEQIAKLKDSGVTEVGFIYLLLRIRFETNESLVIYIEISFLDIDVMRDIAIFLKLEDNII